MLLGQAGSGAVDDMARLSSESVDSADRSSSPGSSATGAVVPALAGRSWRGRYAAVVGDSARSMQLGIEIVTGITFVDGFDGPTTTQ
jgi:hypothetical protein